MVRILQHCIYLIKICVTYQCFCVYNEKTLLTTTNNYYSSRALTMLEAKHKQLLIIFFISYLCWFALFHVWF